MRVLLMSRLTTDPLLRKACQLSVVAGLILLLTLQLGVTVLLVGRHLQWFTSPPEIQMMVVALLEFPFDREFASFSMIMAGVLPVAVAGVCYQLDQTTMAPTGSLNRTGHASALLLMGGMVVGVLAIIAIGVYEADFAAMMGVEATSEEAVDAETSPSRIAVRNTLTAILGFQSLYFTQIVGFKS